MASQQHSHPTILAFMLVPALMWLLPVGCSSPSAPVAESGYYTGAGRGETLGEAINAAKMDAVRKAVIDLIGPQAEAAHAEELDRVLYSTRNPNAFVYTETMETLRRDGSLIEGDLIYELRIRVNVPAVRTTLEVNGLLGATGPRSAAGADTGSGSGDEAARESGGPADTDETTQASQADLAPAAGDWQDVTPEEERFIRRYVETMTYMVYFSEDAAVGVKNSEFIMRSAVNQANSYLVADGRVVVDANQVERLKEDQQLVYEEETGREISLLQWVARRLNADVYIELGAQVRGRAAGGNYYGSADVTLNMFDTSTGQILGSVNRKSQESFSRSSEEDAILNAVQATVYQAMPSAVDMAREQMARALTRGIRYEVTIQNPPDARSVSRFRTTIGDRVREIATVSQSPNEVLFEVFYVGSTDDLVDLFFEMSDRVAGFEDMVLVISRGRSVTFDAGY
jgi:hypothetical protein